MAVGCGAKFAKVMLIIFNVIFLCSGLVLMALGIWLLVTLSQSYGPSQIFTLASGSYLYRNAAILLISIGCFILFITIFGLVAAIRESAVMLSIYAVLLFLVFGGEIAGGVVAIVYKDKILDTVDKTLRSSITFDGQNSTYYVTTNSPNQCKASLTGKVWDYVQLWFGCCGVDNYNSGYYKPTLNQCNFTMYKWPSLQQPLTCCYNTIKSGSFDSDNQEQYANNFNCTSIYTSGCEDNIKAWIVKFAPILIGIGIGFGMLEMFGFIFVICLCMNTDKGFKRF